MYRWLLVLTVSLLLVSCGSSSGSSVSVQTNRWQLDGNGFVQLLTNDEQYYGRVFVTDFTQTSQTRMDTVTAVVKKQSGSLYGGYGIIFCYGDSNNYYRLLIDAAGQYSVYAKINGVDTAIIPWTVTTSPNLKTGVGVENVISVLQITLSNFAIYFNGVQESSFNDTTFSGGTVGFAAYVNTKDLENFPYTAVDVRFKLTSPLAYP
jgi:hypothetical protein